MSKQNSFILVSLLVLQVIICLELWSISNSIVSGTVQTSVGLEKVQAAIEIR